MKRSFEQTGEILEGIVLHQSRHPEFWSAGKKCEREPSVVRQMLSHAVLFDHRPLFQEFVNLTENNSSTWLLRSKTVLSPDVMQPQQTEINEVLGLMPGDCILLSRRSRVPKVGNFLFIIYLVIKR
jgi:hypothetical protein